MKIDIRKYKCSSCGSKSFAVGPAQVLVAKTIVENFPAIECLKCGQKILDKEKLAEIEKVFSKLDIYPAIMSNEEILKNCTNMSWY